MGGIHLYGRDIFHQSRYQIGIEPVFQSQNLVLGTQNLLFILFQFLRDITFRIGQCLLSYPLGRHLVFMRIPYLYIIAEHIVIAYLETGNTRFVALALLNLQQIVLSRKHDAPQVVQFGIHPISHEPSLVEQHRWVVLYFPSDTVAHHFAFVQLFAYAFQAVVLCSHAGMFQRTDSLQCRSQLHQFARVHSSHCHFGDNSFQVAHLV